MAKESYTEGPDQNRADSSPVLVPPSKEMVDLPKDMGNMASEPTNKVFSILDLAPLTQVHDKVYRCIGYGLERRQCGETPEQDAQWEMPLGPYMNVDLMLMTCKTMREWSDYDNFALLFQHQNSDECGVRVTLQHSIRDRVVTGFWRPKYFCTRTGLCYPGSCDHYTQGVAPNLDAAALRERIECQWLNENRSPLDGQRHCALIHTNTYPGRDTDSSFPARRQQKKLLKKRMAYLRKFITFDQLVLPVLVENRLTPVLL